MAGIFLPGSSKPGGGDITAVTAGVGLSGGGDSDDVTLTLDLSELNTVAPINGDFFATLDSDGTTEQKTSTTALATLFAGTGLTATNSVIAVDAAQTQITSVGTIATGTWEGTTIAVDQGGTGATSLSNLITLTTHTSGNYVATITGGTGITSSAGTTGEGTTHSLSVDAAQTGITSLGTQAANFAVGNGYGVIIGNATQETVSIGDGATDLIPELQVLGTAAADSSILLAAFSNTATTAGSPILAFAKGGHATLGSHTVVTDGEELGNIIAFGDDGTDLETPAASIQFEVDGTPGAGDMPGRIILGTTADGATAVTEALRIDSSQNVTVAKSIIIDSTPSNPSYSGITATFTAGETLEAGEVVYFKAGDSKMWKAVANTGGTGLVTAEIMCVAMAAEDISADDPGLFLLQGFLHDATNFPAYTIGETLYVPEAEVGGQNVPEGAAPDTDGDFVQVIGWAASADSVYFSPNFTMVEVA